MFFVFGYSIVYHYTGHGKPCPDEKIKYKRKIKGLDSEEVERTPPHLLKPITLRNPCRAFMTPCFMRILVIHALYCCTVAFLYYVFPHISRIWGFVCSLQHDDYICN